MDRFIAVAKSQKGDILKDLKSNMDRFIAVDMACKDMLNAFKIQYG